MVIFHIANISAKRKKIEALESYAKELDEKASDIREYIKELSSTN